MRLLLNHVHSLYQQIASRPRSAERYVSCVSLVLNSLAKPDSHTKSGRVWLRGLSFEYLKCYTDCVLDSCGYFILI